MPYAAPSSQAKTLYQTVGPGRRAQLEGHSSTAPAAGFSRGAQLNSTRERSDNNRFRAPVFAPNLPYTDPARVPPLRYPSGASGSDDYMSLDDGYRSQARPLSRESSASNQTGLWNRTSLPNLFPTPKLQLHRSYNCAISARGSTIGTTSYTEVRPLLTGIASREPVWDRDSAFRFESSHPCALYICKVKPGLPEHAALTCASKLEENKKAQHSRTGPSPSTSGKCIVCKGPRRPCQSSALGRPYPTCGLNCASDAPNLLAQRRKANAIVEKAVSKLTWESSYEYCGRECRDKAKNLLEEAIAGTCRTCLVCWSALGPNADLPTCGERCHRHTEALAPTMIEIPRGPCIVSINTNRRFRDGWGGRSEEEKSPTVQHTYYFVQNHWGQRSIYKVQGRTQRQSSYGQQPVRQEFWVSLWRECNTGDSGEVNLCLSHSCPFCDVVRNGFQPVPLSLEGSSWPQRSDQAYDNLKRGGLDQLDEGDDVNIVEYKYGRRVETGDVYVF
ncbi:hypothetical protein FA13DRAFT_1733784, partial [Coprinellus micaceus]